MVFGCKLRFQTIYSRLEPFSLVACVATSERRYVGFPMESPGPLLESIAERFGSAKETKVLFMVYVYLESPPWLLWAIECMMEAIGERPRREARVGVNNFCFICAEYFLYL